MLAALRLLGFIGMIALCFLPLQILVWMGRYGLHTRTQLLRLFYYGVAFCLQVHICVRAGEASLKRPLLVVSNHCSYLDVAVLGSRMPLRFTPKAEVRGWPLIGRLCTMAACVYIDRSRAKTTQNKNALQKAVDERSAISLFPEGTTNDGTALLPFRSSYFSLAEEYQLPVQPVTIRYSHRDGTPLSRAEMDKVAWFGDAEFAPHLWEYLHTKGVRAEITFHPEIAATTLDRKQLAAHCQQVIASALQ